MVQGPTTSSSCHLTSNNEGKGISNNNSSFDEASDDGWVWEMASTPTHNNLIVKRAGGCYILEMVKASTDAVGRVYLNNASWALY
jgi:hypothetical protein